MVVFNPFAPSPAQGQRVLDGISAEERLMRELPRKITRVVVFHPSQVCMGAQRPRNPAFKLAFSMAANVLQAQRCRRGGGHPAATLCGALAFYHAPLPFW